MQFTPPGSECSIQFGVGLTSAAPGSGETCSSCPTSTRCAPRSTSRARTRARSSMTAPAATTASIRTCASPGPDPERRTYASFAEFRDPDGNVWQLQEITSRLPGRVDDEDGHVRLGRRPRTRAAAGRGGPRRAREADGATRRRVAGLVRRATCWRSRPATSSRPELRRPRSGRRSCVDASASEMAHAALTSPMWLNAWGKLPRSSPLSGSISSARRPTSLTKATARSNTARARSVCPASASACESQNVQSRKLTPPRRRARRRSGSGRRARARR